MDKHLCYRGIEIRAALLLVAREHPDAMTPLLRVAFHLGLDVADKGDIMAGWPEGTQAPPLGGFRLDVPMVEQ